MTTTVLEKAELAEGLFLAPLEHLEPAPWNARKTFNEKSLAELRESIRARGVQSPLIVRPLGKPNGHKQAAQHYEIVAGHRRFECALELGLLALPCIAREVGDTEAREIGLVDNLQREGLAPLEEAEAFAELLRKPGSDTASLANAVGKAPGYVARRLTLLKAIEPVQEALRSGAIEVGHALELARLDEGEQRAKLQYLRCGYSSDEPRRDEDDFDDNEFEDTSDIDDDLEEEARPESPQQIAWRPTPVSVSELRSFIGRTSLRLLAAAPFPLELELKPMACTGCPKRSGTANLLFDDCAQDTCTDRACFEAKIAQWVEIELERAQEQKRPLLKLSENYQRDKGVLYHYDLRVIKDNPCSMSEAAIWIDGDARGRIADVCRNKACTTHYGSYLSVSEKKKADPAKAKAERKKLLEKVGLEKKYRLALLKAIGASATFFEDGLNLELVSWAIHRANIQQEGRIAEALGWPKDIFDYRQQKQLRAKLESLLPAMRMKVALLAVQSRELAVSEYSLNSKPEDLEKLAGLSGVKVAEVRASVFGAPAAKKKAAKKNAGKTDSLPARSAKQAAQGAATRHVKAAPKKAEPKKKKTSLSSAAKKRIADAQRKRWAAAKKAGKK